MFHSAIRYFYPDLKQEEIKKFSLLGVTFFFTIGAYWISRLLKDTVFFKIAFPESLGWVAGQGRLLQPLAKTWSPFVVFALIMIYAKLVDLFKKDTLFYIICSFFSLIFGGITIALITRNMWGDAALGRTVLAGVGWTTYFATEAFGSLVVALFWSFTNSITDSASAKRGYPLVFAAAQFGAIGGSSLMLFAHKLGVWLLFALVTIFTASIMFFIYYFMRVIPADQMVGDKHAAATEKRQEGFLEGLFAGLKLLATRPYLMGILVISTFYEVINTVIEYQMKSYADIYPQFSGEVGFARFSGIYGMAVNGLSFLMVLLGTSYLFKRFGLRISLFFFPICLTLAYTSLFLFSTFGSPTHAQLLWSTFFVMMIAKGLGYAVNNPVKELMYIPTSKDAKYKTKSFIDVFGGRTAKLTGAQITNTFKNNLNDLMFFGTMFSFGLTAVWLLAAFYVGNKNAQLVRDGKIIE